jgi:hypothetical protein
MAVSVQNLFHQIFHKIPRRLDVCLKFTGAADVDADGYTINYGNDVVASVVKNGEGVIDITLKGPVNAIPFVSVGGKSLKTYDVVVTSVTVGATPVVKLTVNVMSDHSTATDPDNGVFYVFMVCNLSNVGVK